MNTDINGPAGIEYHGVAGSSEDCRAAALRLLQGGMEISKARLLTADHAHGFLLTNGVGDLVAIKSGFASGYRGGGPRALSAILELLRRHGAEIDECDVSRELLTKLDGSALTSDELEAIEASPAVRPGRWGGYIFDDHHEAGEDGKLWREFPMVVPFALIEPRLMDLALRFEADPDGVLHRGYRRLEDIVRNRTGLKDHGAKLFARAFGKQKPLNWGARDGAETEGRVQLFAAIYMGWRNPGAHREDRPIEPLAEFLMLNQLFRLEAEAIEASDAEA